MTAEGDATTRRDAQVTMACSAPQQSATLARASSPPPTAPAPRRSRRRGLARAHAPRATSRRDAHARDWTCDTSRGRAPGDPLDFASRRVFAGVQTRRRRIRDPRPDAEDVRAQGREVLLRGDRRRAHGPQGPRRLSRVRQRRRRHRPRRGATHRRGRPGRAAQSPASRRRERGDGRGARHPPIRARALQMDRGGGRVGVRRTHGPVRG